MNGPDLTFLAERSSMLEDRTPERLAGVHDRIEDARRRRRGAAIAVAVAVVAVVGLGLALVGGASDRTTPSPAPAPSPPSGLTAEIAPKAGTCWAMPGDNTNAVGIPYDASPQVPCSEPHTTETVASYYLERPTQAQAEKVVDDCTRSITAYIGIENDAWVPWTGAMALPSHEQIADGASWVRCDAAVPEALGYPSTLGTMTQSIEGIAQDPPVEFLACTADRPVAFEQPRIPCDEPHAFEETGSLVVLQAPETYPTSAELAAAEPGCAATVPADLDGRSVSTLWDPRSDFKKYNPVYGVCFMSMRDGSLLPAR